MAVSAAVYRSSLNISKISSSVFNTNKSLDKASKTNIGINKTLFKRNQQKRKNITQGQILFLRRREAVRRREQESIIEASRVSGPIQRQRNIIAESTKGFLGRILDFIGTVMVGWLLNNLPTIIGLAQELIARIQKFVGIMGSFVSNTVKIFKTFGDTLGAIYKDVSSFDITFTNTRSQVEKSMNELDDAFFQLNTSFEEALSLFTTPLTGGAYSGQPVPEPGSQWGAGEEEPTPSGGGFSGSGVSKGVQIARRLQKDLGLKDYQAAAVVGNLLQENTTLGPDVLQGSKRGLLTQVMGKGRGYGWAQWTDPGRQQELYQLAQSMGVDPSKQPLTDEINYAMLVSELPRYDSGGRFRASRNIEEASNWLLEQYFRPGDRGTREQKERIADGQKVLQKLKSRPESTPAQVSPAPGVSTTVIDELDVVRDKSKLGGLTPGQGFGAARGGGRRHKGIDIGTYGKKGFYVSLRKSGKVVFSGVSGAYGITVDIVGPDGTCYRFAHLAKSMVKAGQTYNGQTIGEIGKTGRSSDIHLHFEVRPGGPFGAAIDPRPYLGLLAIGRQLTGQAGQPAQVSTPTPTPAQISALQRRTATPESLAKERKGATVVVAESPQVSQTPSMPSIQESLLDLPQIIPDTLNRYINQKLLLDLSYT